MPNRSARVNTTQAKPVAKHSEESPQKRYGERAEEVAWRVVHSELSRGERKQK